MNATDHDQPTGDLPMDGNPDPVADIAEQEDGESASHRHAGLISWIISGALHATLIMLMGTIYFIIQRDEDADSPPLRITAIPPPPVKPIEKPLKRDLFESKVVLDIESTVDQPSPISTLDLPVETAQREEESDSPVPKGREEAIAEAEAGGVGAFLTIGPGGGGAGMFGSRSGGGRKRAGGRTGASKGSEGAVEAALRWFKRHQSPNGMWDAERYFQNCTEDPKCEPGSLENYAAEQVNVAMTGYALLAFLGAGYDHKTANTYKQTVKRGVDYLLSVQKSDGLLGARNYEHPVAVMALAEAYAMTNDPDLRGPAQKGVDIILARQNKDDGGGAKTGESSSGGLGWDYQAPSRRNDSSVTGWNVMALKSAYAGGLNVGNGMTSSKTWLERVWKANNDGKEGRPDWQKIDPYTSESLFSYCWNGSTEYVKEMGHQNMAPVGMVCAVFMGHKAGDPMLESLANYVAKRQTPTTYPCNTYYLYYNTLGMFQVGGDKWKAWNGVVREMLVGAQKRGNGCFDGSWDFEGTGFHGHKIGRVLSTAYNTLSLEVYYRYAQMQMVAAGKR